MRVLWKHQADNPYTDRVGTATGRFGALFIMSFVPWLYGGVTGSAQFLTHGLISALFFFVAVPALIRTPKPGQWIRYLLGITGFEIVLLLVIALFFLQLIPLPLSVMRVVSPMREHIEQKSDQAVAVSVYDSDRFGSFDDGDREISIAPAVRIPLSIAPYRTLRGAIHAVFLLLWFVLVAFCFRLTGDIRLFFRIIILLGVAQSIYGFSEYLSGHQHVFAYYKPARNFLSGSFINRNHCASFLSMSFFISLGYLLHLLERFSLRPEWSWKKKLTILLSEKNVSVLFWVMCPIIIGLGLVFTLSRSALICSGLAGLFLFSVHYFKHSAWKNLVFLFVIIMIAFCITGLTGLGESFELLYEQYKQGLGRVFMWQETLAIWNDFPVSGSGLNSFVRIHPHYRLFSGPTYLDHAHNDYLELLSEGGIAALFLLLFLGFRLVSSFLSGLRVLDIPHFTLFSGAFAAILVMAMHEFTDFSLHIPANQILFLSILALMANILACGQKRDRQQLYRAKAGREAVLSQPGLVNELDSRVREPEILD